MWAAATDVANGVVCVSVCLSVCLQAVLTQILMNEPTDGWTDRFAKAYGTLLLYIVVLHGKLSIFYLKFYSMSVRQQRSTLAPYLSADSRA